MHIIKNLVPFPSLESYAEALESPPITIQLTKQEAAAIAAILGGLEVEDVEGLVDHFLKEEEDEDTHDLCQTVTADPSHPFNHALGLFELIANHFCEE